MKQKLLYSLITTFILLSHLSVFAADVPYTIEFAGMTLRISEQGRKRIQADMDLLTKNDKYHQMKLERVDMYFPLIEKVLDEEGLPADFKYLAVQESSLVSDAVSTSNAVGYWQFKKESALEVGMVVNADVDERKHIVTATRGAARYLKRNNFFLKNWVYTLLSYNLGLGGSKSIINQRDIGAEKMDIDVRTHWYVIKFLAHKLVFQEITGKNNQPALTLLQYADCKGKTLQDISRHMEIPVEELELYNKWLDKKRIPEDRNYSVIIPAPASQVNMLMAKLNTPQTIQPGKEEKEETILAFQSELNTAFPVLEKKKSRRKTGKQVVLYTINGKPGIQAQPGDNIIKIAEVSGISREKFIKYNDLKANEDLIPGEVYYLRKKRKKASVKEHIVTEGETVWQISQRYGITQKALLRKNRMKRPEKLKHGRVVWLRNIRPSKVPVEIRNIPKPATAIASKVVVKPETKTQQKPVSKPAEEKKPVAITAESKKPAPKVTQDNKQIIEPDKEKKSVVKPVEEKKPASIIKEKIITKPIEEKKVVVAPVEKEMVEEQTKETTAVHDSQSKPVPAILEPTEQIENATTQETASVDTPVETSQTEVFPATPATTAKTHVVTKGQSLYAISKLYQVTIPQLREWNNLQESDGLRIGQSLIIEQAVAAEIVEGPKQEESAEYIEYTVKTGDSLYKIAKEHSVTIKEIATWNNKSNHGVAVGEKLKIKIVN